MPLPKMPSKPAALLSPIDYPKAEKGLSPKPAISLVEPVVPKISQPPAARLKTETPPSAKSSGKPLRSETPKSPASRAADKRGVMKLFVLLDVLKPPLKTASRPDHPPETGADLRTTNTPSSRQAVQHHGFFFYYSRTRHPADPLRKLQISCTKL